MFAAKIKTPRGMRTIATGATRYEAALGALGFEGVEIVELAVTLPPETAEELAARLGGRAAKRRA